jgi:hypothetical protein
MEPSVRIASPSFRTRASGNDPESTFNAFNTFKVKMGPGMRQDDAKKIPGSKRAGDLE